LRILDWFEADAVKPIIVGINFHPENPVYLRFINKHSFSALIQAKIRNQMVRFRRNLKSAI